jgi:hypothetical protein
MFMILDLPAAATRGRHEIQLYGPGPGRTSTHCNTNPTDRVLMATITVTLGP